MQRALAEVAAGAAARDRDARLPLGRHDRRWRRAGALSRRGPISREWELVRAVAQADGSVGRIVDGHYNAVERIELLAAEPLRSAHLEEVAAGQRWLGVWGADPAPGEGEPARVVRAGDELTLEGVKTFCSGAGGLDGALVVARDGEARRVAYVDLSAGVEIDRSWFAAAGMRASESHLVRFHGARVHALLGGPDELLRDPWFGRDAIRTAASWAGIADAARAAALEALAPRALAGDDLAALAVGRIDTHAQTIDLWLAEAGRRADAHPDAAMRACSVHLREAVARAAQAIVDEALRAAGRARWRAAAPSTARPATCASSCSSTGSTRCSCAPDARRSTGDADARALRGALRGRPRPVGLRDERLRARRSTSARWPRSATAATARAFEAGCSIGVFTALLADRCDELLAVDIAQTAVEAARGRLAARTHVHVERRTLPQQWPAGPFDLVVCSEILYYWDRPTLEAALPPSSTRWPRAGAWSPSTTARRRASTR